MDKFTEYFHAGVKVKWDKDGRKILLGKSAQLSLGLTFCVVAVNERTSSYRLCYHALEVLLSALVTNGVEDQLVRERHPFVIATILFYV